MPRAKKKPAEPPIRCADCAFWIRAQSDTPVQPAHGECRRYPPQIYFDDEHGPGALWPMTEDVDNCGEWRARMNA